MGRSGIECHAGEAGEQFGGVSQISMGRLTSRAPPLGSAPLFQKKTTLYMANTKSAAKRARQNAGRSEANKRVTTVVKNQLRLIRAAVTAGKKSEALALLPKVSSALDKAAKTGRIHQNKANRHKGDLARQLAALK